MQDLVNELNQYRHNLNKAIEELKKRGQVKAKTERDYRVELSKEILRLRAEGIPVTIINDLARGNEKIANLKMERDIAESLYESNMQYIYSCKINIDIVQKQIEAERKGE
ncbi:hypothetical protein [Tepidimicrobium xylanilyticum]|uniref:Uncharacterized protein n=1 Tax=Tepidimicrobium xylanilyticum TaxID=1123352 RepID=A0A1H3F2R2_9FIRM|nr:hypothetical protein [Tepidimicrobium xylanilyticum]SDX85271.1 hypothetical protein SAMN05660923_03049 [Tepidimicrobium xylanilyticum]